MVKKASGWVLVFLGVFLIVAAVLMATVGPGITHRTPLNVDSDTYLTGQAKKLNPITGKVEDVPVKVFSKTTVDPKKSDGDVVVFVNYTCVNIDRDDPPNCVKKDDDRLITNGLETFATDRRTAEAVNKAKYEGKDPVEFSGLVNKFPFDTEKKSYTYWDGLLDEAVPVKYVSETRLDGLKVYKFTIDVPKTDAKIAGEIEGTYQTEKTLYVEPVTGSIVKQSQHEKRLLPDGSTVLDMALEFTPKTVTDGIKDSKANVSKLSLVSSTLPIILGIVGLIALLVGVVLMRRDAAAAGAGATKS